jgi:hypothetical protein
MYSEPKCAQNRSALRARVCSESKCAERVGSCTQSEWAHVLRASGFVYSERVGSCAQSEWADLLSVLRARVCLERGCSERECARARACSSTLPIHCPYALPIHCHCPYWLPPCVHCLFTAYLHTHRGEEEERREGRGAKGRESGSE